MGAIEMGKRFLLAFMFAALFMTVS